MLLGGTGSHTGAAMVPLDRALLSFYRLSMVTIPLQFAMQILTGGNFDPKLPLPVQDRGSCLIQSYLGHTSVSAKWHLIPSNGFSEVHECDRRSDRGTDHATITSVAIGGIAFSDAA